MLLLCLEKVKHFKRQSSTKKQRYLSKKKIEGEKTCCCACCRQSTKNAYFIFLRIAEKKFLGPDSKFSVSRLRTFISGKLTIVI
jgi:hypothetical protein